MFFYEKKQLKRNIIFNFNKFQKSTVGQTGKKFYMVVGGDFTTDESEDIIQLIQCCI